MDRSVLVPFSVSTSDRHTNIPHKLKSDFLQSLTASVDGVTPGMRDASKNPEAYEDFYEELGQKYPETSQVHNKKKIGTRYWTVISELIPFARRRLKLIDIGCNDGLYSIPYVLFGGTAVGIDISQSLVDKASKTAEASGVSSSCKFIRASVGDKALRTMHSDLILLSEVLEHLPDTSAALQNIRFMLDTGGNFLLTTPTPTFENVRQYSIPYVIDAVFRSDKLQEPHLVDTAKVGLNEYKIAHTLYPHNSFYPRALQVYVESFGFHCLKLYTMDYPNKFRKPFGVGNSVRGELMLRQFPLIRYAGKTIIALFEATLPLQ